MKTLFAVGFQATQDLWDKRTVSGVFLGQRRGDGLGQVAAYGSVPSGSLTQDQRNAVYAMIKDAMMKVTEVDTWIHAAGEGGQKAAMGSSFDLFRSYINRAAELGETVWPLYSRLGNGSAEDSYILEGDENKVVEFVNTVNQAYQLYVSKLKGGPAPAPVPAAPTVKAPAAPSTGIMPEAKILGMQQTTFIGALGLVVIAGVLGYGLLK